MSGPGRERGESEPKETENGLVIVKPETVGATFDALSKGNKWGIRVEVVRQYLMHENVGLGAALDLVMSKYPSEVHTPMMEAAAMVIIAMENQIAINRLEEKSD